jgi:hypothetical protein
LRYDIIIVSKRQGFSKLQGKVLSLKKSWIYPKLFDSGLPPQYIRKEYKLWKSAKDKSTTPTLPPQRAVSKEA